MSPGTDAAGPAPGDAGTQDVVTDESPAPDAQEGTSEAGPTDAAFDGASSDASLIADADAASTDAAQVFAVGGHLAGLTTGESLVLQDNSGDDLTLDANGDFVFPATLAAGQPYAVTIETLPTSPIAQTCSVVNGTGTVTGAIPSVAVDCDMLAYFPFRGNAKDASGYGNDAAVTNGVLTTDHSGDASGAYAFTGHGYIDAPMPAGLLPSGNAARTLTAWIEPTFDQSEWGVVYYGSGNCTAKMYGIGRQGGGTAFWSGCNDVQSTLAFPVNAWTFVAIAYDGSGSLAIYANGQSSTSSVNSLATPTTGDLIMGADLSNGVTFTGNIGAVRVYGHALSAAEVQSIYTSAAP